MGVRVVTGKGSAEPLYDLIRKIRQPATFRELMAACLRSVYMGDPFTVEGGTLIQLPEALRDEVLVEEQSIAGIRCVIYSPEAAEQPLPLMLYMHGGGFVIGCSEDTDYITRMLCHMNQCVVVSINYRLAPETVFPGALDDCAKVLDGALDLSSELKLDTTSIYLAGDSAGGNLAVALYYYLQRHKQAIKGLILLAPWLDMEVEKYDSYNKLAPTGIVFDSPFLAYSRAAYVGFEQWKNPLVSPLFSALKEMPPTVVVSGTDDSLTDQTLALKQKAVDSGCKQLEFAIYPGMPHCFYSLPGLFVEEKDCYNRIFDFIKRSR